MHDHDETKRLCERLDQRTKSRLEEARLDRHAEWFWLTLWLLVGAGMLAVAYHVISINICGCH